MARRALAVAESDTGQGDAASAIDRLVDVLARSGRGAEKETRALAERAVALRRSAGGPDDAALATSLVNLGSVLAAAAEFRAAQEALEQALSLRTAAAGPDAAGTAAVKERLGALLANSGKSAGALVLLEEAAGSLADPTGDKDAELATVLTTLGGVLTNRGILPAARDALDRALAIRIRLYGDDHPEVAATLFRQAFLKRKEGEAAPALALVERALAIREARLPKGSLDIASALGLIAELRFDRGDLPGARASAERALALRRAALSPGHPLLATGMKTLAGVLWEQGHYAEARPLFEQALAIERAALGPAHPQVALSLTNLGNILSLVGDDAAALESYGQARAIADRAMTPAQRAMLLTETAVALNALGRGDEARRNLEEALAGVEADHWQAGWILYILGLVEETRGDRAAADAAAARARATLSAALGEDHVKLGLVTLLQARLRQAEGRANEADALFAQALHVLERSVGPDHLEVSNTLSDWSEARWQAGRPDEALEHALRAARIRREILAASGGAFSEREALRFRRSRGPAIDLALSRLASGGAPREAIARTCDEVIRSRAQVLDEVAWRQRLARESTSERAGALVAELDQARTRLSRLTLAVYGSGGGQTDRSALDRARLEREEAERALARWSASAGLPRARRDVGLAEVRAALPERSALIGFVRYARALPPSAEGSSAPEPPRPEYLAFVLRPETDDIGLVALGPADRIEALVRDWRREAGHPPDGREAMGRYRAAARGLAQAVWTPLQRPLADRDLVLIVPDGALQFVSWPSLPSSAGAYLVESGPTIHLLSAERGVALDGQAPAGRGLLAIGGPDFGAAPASSPCAGSSIGALTALPSAAEEARDVGALWKREEGAGSRETGDVSIFTGRGASEAAFRSSAPGRRVLHLATHGFYLADRCDPDSRGGAGRAATVSDAAEAGSIDTALARTGLAFAGANRAWGDRGADGGADGLLTAQEIAALDLRGVEWAVLSACGSSLGQAEAGEGILGLRRTFEIAGARSLVTSLWDLEDHSARRWIRELYRARLHGASTAGAVRQASRSILESRRRAGLADHPYYWAPFVAAGDWR
ncbi:MAG TPA: CHAT domain-containing tetratricopeptide repeat protein [Candidatus Polarisedimenticolia bacterium]|nr:CHAT domain-containing tetratricopeptide repeat protein [Candidatus Polarisedimenticolia bacterium]